VWRWLLATPGLPDRVRGTLAMRVTKMLVAAGRTENALATATAAAGRVHAPRVKAGLLGASLDPDPTRRGGSPAVEHWWAGQLERADALYASGRTEQAADLVAAAMMLAFHRGLHFDRLWSPLAEDPDGFLAPLRRSRVVHAMNGATRLRPPEPAGRPLRLLIAFHLNDNFLREIRERYEGLDDVEVRYLDLSRDAGAAPLLSGGRMPAMAEHLVVGDTPYGRAVERALRPHLDWADTVFVEWCNAAAVAFTMVDPGGCRVIVRLHSYELFTAWPHLVNFGRVDDVVLVSEHLRRFATAVLPRLGGPDRPRVSVIPNAVDLERFSKDKPAAARFTLGLVGIGTVAKDPRWAIEVLRRLRDRDSRYRLVLIGDDMDATLSGSVAHYHRLLQSDLAELEPGGAVRRLGRIDDIPQALIDVGVILSTSVRESFHLGLVEGAASGAVPVVRNWPYFAAVGGARGLFPADWLVDTPEEAAERVLRLTGTDERWRAAGAQASSYVRTTWTRAVTMRAFDRLLLSTDEATMKGSPR
jgi:glycosyltransferase involved in cell wall biosynthesis